MSPSSRRVDGVDAEVRGCVHRRELTPPACFLGDDRRRMQVSLMLGLMINLAVGLLRFVG